MLGLFAVVLVVVYIGVVRAVAFLEAILTPIIPRSIRDAVSTYIDSPFAPNKATTLVGIRISHCVEKARWALDIAKIEYVEISCAPVTHLSTTLLLSAGKSSATPMLITQSEQRILTSSDQIMKFASDKIKTFSLYPNDDASELERYFNKELVTPVRRWVYSYLLLDPYHRPLLKQLFSKQLSSEYESVIVSYLSDDIAKVLEMSQSVSMSGRASSLLKIEAVFQRVNDLLSDGRKYLCNTNNLSAADISFAANAYPIVMPKQMENITMEMSAISAEFSNEIARFRAMPAGQFVLRMYDEHRGTSRVTVKLTSKTSPK